MLSKCLNPACTSPFRYFRDGRLFQFEIPCSPEGYAAPPRREYFWLCGRCCSTLTVVLRDGQASVQPRYLELASGDRAEESEPESAYSGG